MKTYSRVYAQINLNAVKENMEQMKKNLCPETKMMAVVKTDGYGHGAVPIAKEIEGLPYLFGFAVATVEEAVILRKCGIRKPILILGFTFPDAYETIVKYDIRPAVFELSMAEKLSKEAVKQKKNVRFHIKTDTGMHRIGLRPDAEGVTLVKKIAALSNVELEGIFTHFAKADMKDKEPTKHQIESFSSFIGMLKREGIEFPIRHCSNSAGIIEIPEANMDMVRAGITLYGLWPSEEVRKDIVPLAPVLSMKSRISYIKEIEKGDGVSYGGIYVADERRRVATIPVGYGDGYPRGLSNKGSILIQGKRAPILGRVCMDQFMVDVTEIPEAEELMEVTLIGEENGERITMEELGNLSGRFNYELACDIGKRVPRVFVRDGKVVSVKDYFEDYR